MFSPTPNPRPAQRTLRAAVRRAVDAVVSFALLEDIECPSDTVDPRDTHPHRRPLVATQRQRRPGAGVARLQDCETPLTGRGRQQRQPHIVR